MSVCIQIETSYMPYTGKLKQKDEAVAEEFKCVTLKANLIACENNRKLWKLCFGAVLTVRAI